MKTDPRSPEPNNAPRWRSIQTQLRAAATGRVHLGDLFDDELDQARACADFVADALDTHASDEVGSAVLRLHTSVARARLRLEDAAEALDAIEGACPFWLHVQPFDGWPAPEVDATEPPAAVADTEPPSTPASASPYARAIGAVVAHLASLPPARAHELAAGIAAGGALTVDPPGAMTLHALIPTDYGADGDGLDALGLTLEAAAEVGRATYAESRAQVDAEEPPTDEERTEDDAKAAARWDLSRWVRVTVGRLADVPLVVELLTRRTDSPEIASRLLVAAGIGGAP